MVGATAASDKAHRARVAGHQTAAGALVQDLLVTLRASSSSFNKLVLQQSYRAEFGITAKDRAHDFCRNRRR
jgi:hypothetical protein